MRTTLSGIHIRSDDDEKKCQRVEPLAFLVSLPYPSPALSLFLFLFPSARALFFISMSLLAFLSKCAHAGADVSDRAATPALAKTELKARARVANLVMREQNQPRKFIRGVISARTVFNGEDSFQDQWSQNGT